MSGRVNETTLFPEDIPSGKLSHLFQKTTTSYKLYWFWSIHDLLKAKQGESVFTFDEIIAGMLEKVWYPVVYFRLFFGSQDRLSEVVQKIQIGANLPDNSKDISSLVLQYYQENRGQFKTSVDSFKKYVPFRLLSPWHKSEDHNQIVYEAAKNFQNHENLPLYRFQNENGEVAIREKEATAIEIQPRWKGFLLQNQLLIQDFILWNLADYLQKKNPSIPGIINKLQRPEKRDMGTAQKFWQAFYSQFPREASCIYSGQPVPVDGFSLDHFLPWSYVTHNLIWNLIPTTTSVNSQKSNHIPSEIYLPVMIDKHIKAHQFLQTYKNKMLTEEYDALLGADAIREASDDILRNRLADTLATQMKIAKNAGFPVWQYS